MKISNIHIFPCFQETPPDPVKLQKKEQYYNATGLLQSQIILDGNNYLIDGFTSYLLAPALIYLAVITTIDRPVKQIAARSWEIAFAMLLLCGILQIFGAGMPQDDNFGALASFYTGRRY